MKNKYIQKEFGMCYPTCLANLYDDDWFLKEGGINTLKGTSTLEGVKMVERFTDGLQTIRSVLDSPKCVENYIPIFEDREYEGLDENEDYYTPYIVTIDSLKPGYRHVVVVIKQLFQNKSLTVLDPLKKEAEYVKMLEFFEKYKPYEVEAIFNSELNQPIFPYRDFKHLMV